MSQQDNIHHIRTILYIQRSKAKESLWQVLPTTMICTNKPFKELLFNCIYEFCQCAKKVSASSIWGHKTGLFLLLQKDRCEFLLNMKHASC